MTTHRLAALTALALLAACGPNSPEPVKCATGKAQCNTTCIDITNDPFNCGGCGLACAVPSGGHAVCIFGRCSASCDGNGQVCSATATDAGLTLACTDTSKDPQNCGACGTGCLPQQSCSGGQCTSCGAGQISCGGVCTGILTDNANCGGCGIACASGSSCQGGTCTSQTGVSLCGGADGGPGAAKDLQNDPQNCGACGTACIATEWCVGGRCTGCPVTRCGSGCIDTQHDRNNCGACGNACTGNNQCIDGACGPGISLKLDTPASWGVVPDTSFVQQVEIDSALPVRDVFAEMTLGLPDGGRNFNTFAPEGYNLPGQLWSGTLPIPDGGPSWSGTIRITARDVAWRADAGDRALHEAVLESPQLGVLQQPTGFPSITATVGGAPVTQGSWLPLNAGPITFTATNVNASARSVAFLNTQLSNYRLGSAKAVAGAASLTVQPGEVGADNSGLANVVACEEDVLGTVNLGTCSNGSETSSPSVNFIVGRIPVGAGEPVLTSLPDGGSPAVWMVSAGTNTLFGVSNTALRSEPPDAGLSDQTYWGDTLQVAETAQSVVAVRSNGTTAVDRFDCLDPSCWRTPWITSADSSLFRSIVALTAKTVLMITNNGDYAYAFPAATGSVVSTNTTLRPAGSVPTGNSVFTLQNGAVLFWARTDPEAPNFQLYLLHPASGAKTIGPVVHSVQELWAWPSGEFIYGYLDDANARQIVAGFTDGANVTVTPPFQLNASSVSYNWLRAGSRMLTGFGNELLTGQIQLLVANVSAARHVINAPVTPVAGGTGGVVEMVRSRSNEASALAISDDQLKALHVTEDAKDPADVFNNATYTLWLTDLATGQAAPLFSSPYLLGPANQNLNNGGRFTISSHGEQSPRFVHSSAGAALVDGHDSSGAVATVPAVVFAESLDAKGLQNGLRVTTGRLYYAFYGAGPTPSNPVAVDRPVLVLNQPNNDAPGSGNFNFGRPTAFESSAGSTLLFLGEDAGGRSAVYAAPLSATATGTVPAQLLAAGGYGLQLREDKGRFLLVRADGALLAGRLTASAAPGSTLKPVLLGLVPGPFAPDNILGQNSYGFTADGDHAWAVTNWGSDIARIDFYGTGQLEVADLSASGRTNFGEVTFAPQGNQGSSYWLPCVGQSGQLAVMEAPLAADQAAIMTLQAEFASESPKRGALGVDDNGNNPPSCNVSLDGSEVYVVAQNGTNTSLGVGGSAGHLQVAKFSWQVRGYFEDPAPLASNPPWINGGPFAPATELISGAVQPGALRSVYKVYGESAAFPGGVPFLPVITLAGYAYPAAWHDADSHAARLFIMLNSVEGLSRYPVALPHPPRPLGDSLLP